MGLLEATDPSGPHIQSGAGFHSTQIALHYHKNSIFDEFQR